MSNSQVQHKNNEEARKTKLVGKIEGYYRISK